MTPPDLLRTAAERYAHRAGFHNLFTLSYRSRTAKTGELFARQTRGILQTVGRDMQRFTEQWRKQAKSAETRWLDASRRTKRQTELFFASVEKKMKEERRRFDERLTKTGGELREEARRLALESLRETRRLLRRDTDYERRRKG
jgi:hypothetical protein